jgi:sugar phosphate isomerase/epimerase
MKFALSSAAPDLSIDTIAAEAKKFGYDGIELHFAGAVPEKLQFEGVAVACLNGGDSDSARIRDLIDLANRANCPLIKVGESGPHRPRTNLANIATALGDWLLPLADFAADRNVTLALDNSKSLRTARETWAILDRCNHPSLGCCLDLRTNAILNESPLVVVPMLNSRIVYVQVSDLRNLAEPTVDCDFGAGVVPIKASIARLRGIGYSGWVAVRISESPEKLEATLAGAIHLLREWDQPVGRPKPKAKAAK